MSPVRNALICSAGTSSRLGINTAKCLSPIEGRPVIQWQLDQLDDIENVVVVVGCQASQVIANVMARRPDAVFVINHDHEEASTLDSMMMGAMYFREPFIYLDGDLIVDGSAIELIAEAPCPAIGIRRTYSERPVCVRLGSNGQTGMVTGFTREILDFEWTGLAKLSPEHVRRSAGEAYVYQAIEHYLPVHAVRIDCMEVHTQHDYNHAQAWMRKRLRSESSLLEAA